MALLKNTKIKGLISGKPYLLITDNGVDDEKEVLKVQEDGNAFELKIGNSGKTTSINISETVKIIYDSATNAIHFRF